MVRARPAGSSDSPFQWAQSSDYHALPGQPAPQSEAPYSTLPSPAHPPSLRSDSGPHHRFLGVPHVTATIRGYGYLRRRAKCVRLGGGGGSRLPRQVTRLLGKFSSAYLPTCGRGMSWHTRSSPNVLQVPESRTMKIRCLADLQTAMYNVIRELNFPLLMLRYIK